MPFLNVTLLADPVYVLPWQLPILATTRGSDFPIISPDSSGLRQKLSKCRVLQGFVL